MLKKRIHYSDTDGEPEQTKKHKSKLNNNVQPMDDSTKLTDLKADFLMRTFDELYLDDLSSVAMVNKQFNQLVYSYLGEKCKTGRVTIFITDAAEWFWTSNTMGKFKFDSPAEFVGFFQKSGHLISHMLIDCEPNYRAASYKFMERVIFKYCSDSLTHIEIRSTFLPVLSECLWKYPLWNVTVLKLDACELSAKFGEQLNALFPSLQRLVLTNCQAVDPECIEIHVPDLIDFTFIGLSKNRMVLKKANILKAIQLNPQIERLSVDFQDTNHRAIGNNANDFELDHEFYRCVGEYLPDLKWLKMLNKRHYHAPIACCDNNIEFPNLNRFELADIYDQQPDEITPFAFQHLQELKLIHLKELTAEWMDFITFNVHLTKLTVQIYGEWRLENGEGEVIEGRHKINKNQLLTILKRLQQLKELHVDAKTVDAKDIIAILPKRNSLMTICLREYFMVDSIVDTFDQLTAKKPWIVDYDLENLYLKRS